MVHPRARAGVRGFYVPEMVVRHIIPASRLNKRTSAAGSTGAASAARCSTPAPASTWKSRSGRRSTSARCRTSFGVPRYLYPKGARQRVTRLTAALGGDAVAAFEHELWVWFFAGIVRQRWAIGRAAALHAARHRWR